MKLFIGDLGNTANQFVLASFVCAIVMQVLCELFRRMANYIVVHERGAGAVLQAKRHYWWAIGFQRGGLGLMCLAVLTQQVRLQTVKTMLADDGVNSAIPVSTMAETEVRGLNELHDAAMVYLADPEDAACKDERSGPSVEITTTTPNGTTISVRRVSHTTPARSDDTLRSGVNSSTEPGPAVGKHSIGLRESPSGSGGLSGKPTNIVSEF